MRDGEAREHDGAARGLDGGDHRSRVVRAAGSFLAPSGDEQQRVVDRDPETDERDEELDDERHLRSGR